MNFELFDMIYGFIFNYYTKQKIKAMNSSKKKHNDDQCDNYYVNMLICDILRLIGWKPKLWYAPIYVNDLNLELFKTFVCIKEKILHEKFNFSSSQIATFRKIIYKDTFELKILPELKKLFEFLNKIFFNGYLKICTNFRGNEPIYTINFIELKYLDTVKNYFDFAEELKQLNKRVKKEINEIEKIEYNIFNNLKLMDMD